MDGTLDQADITWDRRTALGVVLASQLPQHAAHRRRHQGLPADAEDCMVFHAATRLEGDEVQTTGGRVLCVTALGDSVKMARDRVYEAIDGIHFDGRQYRSDIGWRALKPSQQKTGR